MAEEYSFINNNQSVKENTWAMSVRIVLRLSFGLEADNWRDLLHQYFHSLSAARSLKLFWATRHLSVFRQCVFCFLDATNSSMEQPTDTNLELSSAFSDFARKIWRRRAAKKGAKSKKQFECNDARFWLDQKRPCAIVDWLYFHTWNSCTPFWLAVYVFFTCENKAFRILQISFME